MREAGILLLSLVPILFGMQIRGRLLREGRIRSALLRFFESVKFEIEAFSRPQQEIFSGFEDPDLEKTHFLKNLREEVNRDPCGALIRALTPLTQEVSFSQREENALLEFARFFGMQSKEAQLKDCDKLLFLLRSEEEKTGKTRAETANLARSAGLCIGIGIFILLI